MCQHVYNGSTRRKGEKGTETILKELMTGKLPNLMKNTNVHIKGA